jgi:hypothetical protein
MLRLGSFTMKLVKILNFMSEQGVFFSPFPFVNLKEIGREQGKVATS